jgi:hypothetical protein
MTPTATLFWSSIIRHALAGIGAVIVAHGYATPGNANAYIEELTGAALYVASQMWSNRVALASRAKMLTALWMPRGTTEAAVDAHIAQGLPTPAVTTPPTSVPGVPAS